MDSGSPLDSFDPATGEKIGTYAEADAAEADRAVAVVVTQLAAVPFSVKPGGAARGIAVAGGGFAPI